MGTCPNCGRWTVLSSAMDCKLCHKVICKKCAIYMFKVWSPDRIILDKWYACSEECLDEFVRQVEKEITLKDKEMFHRLSEAIPVIVKRVFDTGRESNFVVNFAPIQELDYEPRDNRLWQKLQRLGEHSFTSYEMLEVQNWIKAGRFEDAAKFYEARGLYEEAGKLRAKGREITVKDIIVKKTEVSVDLNSLLQQIADGGIVAVYRCPHCGGRLKIGKETSVASLRVCEHCGSQIETMDLADFLKTVLS